VVVFIGKSTGVPNLGMRLDTIIPPFFRKPIFYRKPVFPFSAYILSHLCVTFVFLFFCRAVRASPWIGAVGQGLSVFVRATRGSFFLTIEPFSVPTDLFKRVVPVRKSDRSSMLRVTNYSHQAWRRSTVSFFSPCLVLAGKKAAGLLQLRSSKRVVEKKN